MTKQAQKFRGLFKDTEKMSEVIFDFGKNRYNMTFGYLRMLLQLHDNKNSMKYNNLILMYKMIANENV